LKSLFTKNDPSIRSEIMDNFSKTKNVQLVDRSFPKLAFNDPSNLEARDGLGY